MGLARYAQRTPPSTSWNDGGRMRNGYSLVKIWHGSAGCGFRAGGTGRFGRPPPSTTRHESRPSARLLEDFLVLDHPGMPFRPRQLRASSATGPGRSDRRGGHGPIFRRHRLPGSCGSLGVHQPDVQWAVPAVPAVLTRSPLLGWGVGAADGWLMGEVGGFPVHRCRQHHRRQAIADDGVPGPAMDFLLLQRSGTCAPRCWGCWRRRTTAALEPGPRGPWR